MSTPIFPKIGTMQSRALAMLLQGEAITHKDFWCRVGSYYLHSPIHELRDKDWGIQGAWEVVPTNNNDPIKRKAHIKRYHLPQNIISKTGKKGREFVLKVLEWEKMRIAGKGATNPANNEASRILTQGTGQEEHSTGGAT